MYIELDPPSGWSHEKVGDTQRWMSPNATVWVHAAPIVGRGVLELRSILEIDRPPLSRWEPRQTVQLATVSGWPMQLITAAMVGPAGDLETRLAAVYEFLHFSGVALAVARDPDVYEEHRLALVAMLGSARPHLRPDEPVTIRELWDMHER
jgi:hypothetical protein